MPLLTTGAGAYPVAAGGVPFSLAWVSGGTDIVGGTTITYSALSFGVADSNRIIAVGVWNRPTGTGANAISSMTIGGISATQVASAFAYDATNPCMSDIWQAAVPTGASGNVVITYSLASTRSAIDLYRIITVTPTATAANGAFAEALAGSQDVTLTISSGCSAMAIYGCRASSSATQVPVWTNATADNSVVNLGGVGSVSGSANSTVVGSPTTINATIPGNTSSFATAMSAAAWGP